MKKIIDEEVRFEDINSKNRPVVSKTDIKGNILYANKMFVELSGYSKEELIGKRHNIIRHPDMPKKVFENLWNTILQGKPWNGIVKNLRKDGRYYWVETYIEPYFDKKGNITGFISARRKINDEKKKEYTKIYKEMKKKEN